MALVLGKLVLVLVLGMLVLVLMLLLTSCINQYVHCKIITSGKVLVLVLLLELLLAYVVIL